MKCPKWLEGRRIRVAEWSDCSVLGIMQEGHERARVSNPAPSDATILFVERGERSTLFVIESAQFAACALDAEIPAHVVVYTRIP